mmetsp:Transcript_26647/g.30615  ORF Transcript_26647/g.30615 Transcript_26647/m.30615 type:complete len:252 (-) Transcript_26647:44-799(-)
MAKIEKSVFLILAFLLLINPSTPKKTITIGLDYASYVFVLLWAPGDCGVFSKCSDSVWDSLAEVNDFTIRGLWPRLSDGTWATNCDPSRQFDRDYVSSYTIQQLETYWLSVGGNHQSQWAHEWSRHGSCVKDLPGVSGPATLEAYFTTSLNLRRDFQLNNIFASSGIFPSYIKTYTRNDLEAPFVSLYGVQPNFVYESHRGDNILIEVHVCLNLHLEPIDCDDSFPHEGQIVEPQSEVFLLPFHKLDMSSL